MGILVDVVRVSGFRAIKRMQAELAPVTVLIGMNNAGKTSLLKALQLALGDYSRYLSDEDFHVGTDGKRVDAIVVDARVVPVSESGERTSSFDDKWASQFGDCIQSDTDGRQYLAIRTRSKTSSVSAGFVTEHKVLNRWPDWAEWPTASVKETQGRRFPGMAYVSIEAQRDIHQDLRDRHSFVGRVLSSVEYEDSDIEVLEELIAEVNNAAVQTSPELKTLRGELDALSGSSLGSHVVELTPFPKRIRDMPKYFTLQTGAEAENTFAMEYHGMGTRSWASILALKAFTQLESERHLRESEPYFAMVAAEEPEAHLHPNAQRVLFEQLRRSCGQVLLSTHSPYLAATAEPSALRHLRIDGEQGVLVSALTLVSGSDDYRRLRREVIHSRGELLFSKLLILCEGETEEQSLPELFTRYFGCPPFAAGATVVGVGGSGSKYLPFFSFARDFGLPVFVFSDGEAQTVDSLKKAWGEVYGLVGDQLPDNVVVLDGTDFEGYLVNGGYATLIEEAICQFRGRDDYVDDWIGKRHGKPKSKTVVGSCDVCGQDLYEAILHDYSGDEGRRKALTDILRGAKTKYAPVVAAALCQLDKGELPEKVKDLFAKMTGAIA